MLVATVVCLAVVALVVVSALTRPYLGLALAPKGGQIVVIEARGPARAIPRGTVLVSVAREGELEVALDQCWDLLRQRCARRKAGEDPDGAAARPGSVVEGYQQ